jgi:hypothetical protein
MTMADLIKKAMARVSNWPEQQQTEAAELLLALDELGPDPITLTGDELAAVDEALAETERGEFADPRDVEAVFARFRK